MSVRIGFPALYRSETLRDLLAQHRYFGGPLVGLRREAERLALFRSRCVVDALTPAQDAYIHRAPRQHRPRRWRGESRGRE